MFILKNLRTKEVIRFNELKNCCQALAVQYLLIGYWSLSEKVLSLRRYILRYHPKLSTVLLLKLELEEVLKELAKWAIRWKAAQTPRVAVKRAQFTSNA